MKDTLLYHHIVFSQIIVIFQEERFIAFRTLEYIKTNTYIK